MHERLKHCPTYNSKKETQLQTMLENFTRQTHTINLSFEATSKCSEQNTKGT